MSVALRKGDKQVEIYEDEKFVKLIFSVFDLEDEPTVVNELKFAKFDNLKIELDDEDKVNENYKILYEFLKAICERKYPTQVLKNYLQMFKKDEITKKALEKYCEDSKCICNLAISMGCINLDRLVDALMSSISQYYSYSLLNNLMRKYKGETAREVREDVEKV